MGKQLLWDGQKYQSLTPLRIILIVSVIPLVLFTLMSKQWILLNIFLPVTGFWTWFSCSNAKKKCKNAINEGYYLSIKQALLTDYPHGIVYILENVLKQFNNYGFNYLPHRETVFERVRGWPNTGNLKSVITTARYIMERWDELNPVEQSEQMANLRAKIQPEDMWLWGLLTKPNYGPSYYQHGCPDLKLSGHHYSINIYKYYYDEEDYRRDRGNKLPKHHVPNVNPEPQPNFPTTYPQPEPPKRILTFEEFLQQHPGLLYLLEREQREEYHKYLASMGLQPPSSTTRSYYPDNSNYVTENREDDSVWHDVTENKEDDRVW
jgi:hypothetical protein